MDLGLLLDMAVRDDPSRSAVTDANSATMTRRDLLSGVAGAASMFQSSGANCIGYLALNSRSLPVAFFGAAVAALPFVPINYRLSDEQVDALIRREPNMLLVFDEKAADRKALRHVGSAVATQDLPSASTGDESTFGDVDPDTVAVRLYTSGTTAAPKAAVLRHRHLTSYVIATTEFGSADQGDAALVSVPPYHIAGISSIVSNLYCGRRIVYLDAFDPARWLDLARREQVTHAMVVPTMLARIVDRLVDGAPGVPTLRSLAYGGAKMPAPVIERAITLLPDVDFTNAYGLTETSSTITLLGPDEHRAAVHSDDPATRARLASAGKPVPGVELSVVDEQGQPCERGRVGDILVRGAHVSGEYADSGVIDAGGWFQTRDRGWLDEEGYLFIEGRADDTIIRGGENIAPAEIEDVLLRHPGVQACAVVGVADEEWGQRIAAVVVPRAGHDVAADELQSWAREHLRGAKTPDLIEFRTELPYTETGKLLRREVVASLVRAAST
jgi:acyl-CoA synthetase (AMP-forming)/AMP-acid ligase II